MQMTPDTPLPPWDGIGIFATNRMKLDFGTQKWVAEPTLLLGSEREIEKAIDDFWNGQHRGDPPSEFDAGELYADAAQETEWDQFMAEDGEDQDVT